jgi:hypothetical protein
MNEEKYRYLFSKMSQQVRAMSNEPIAFGRKMRAGKICSSCKFPLPAPHTPGLKRCASCEDSHLVFMYFRERCGWHCGFRTEDRKKLARELTFSSSTAVRELARRGNGLLHPWDCEGFEIDLELGRGGIWLRLSDQQFLALGGVL